MGWIVTVGQGTGITTLDRVINIRISEEFAHLEFSVTIKNPTADERAQVKGRIDTAIIQISRMTEVIAEGFIEDVESGADYVKYSGRSFLVLTGYSTSSETNEATDKTDAEFSNSTGKNIIESLILDYCTTKDSEVTSSVSLKNIDGVEAEYEGDVKLHGKKVYQIIREMCQSYGHDLWATTTWSGNDITVKTINIGEKTRGTESVPHDTLQGGVHLKNIPRIKYRSSQAINCLRVIGGGTGKDKVSVFVEDETPSPNNSIENNGYIEGETYHNNMIRSVDTAKSIGKAIIDAKRDPIEELHVELAMYINDLEYGDWVNIIDTHSNIDTTKRIKSITRTYTIGSADGMSIELGEKFDDYQHIIRDLTKGDVDNEPNMSAAGGSLKMTANDPPSQYVRIDGGTWYGTDGQPHEISGGRTCAWLSGSDPFPGSSGGYRKAVVQIHDSTHSITSALGEIVLTAELAEATILSADSENIPIGIVILRQAGSASKISDIYDKGLDNTGKSYIYLDARPIIGSSISGYGGEGRWALTTDDTWTASTTYAVGDWIGPTVGNDRSYKCTAIDGGGISGGTEPSPWSTIIGGTIIDNEVTWECFFCGIIVDEISGVTDLDVHVRPIGSGIVYLG